MMARTERVLVDAVARYAERLSLTDGPWLVLRECEWLTRIPDLVLARVDEEALAERFSQSALRTLNETEIRVLRRLSRFSRGGGG